MLAAFLNLEMAFSRVPHEVIWWTFLMHGVPEEYTEWIKKFYSNAESCFSCSTGVTKMLPFKVGALQGSVLSPLQFINVMDAITRIIQKPAPWALMYTDDVFLAVPSKHYLQNGVCRWKFRLQQYGLRPSIWSWNPEGAVC